MHITGLPGSPRIPATPARLAAPASSGPTDAVELGGQVAPAPPRPQPQRPLPQIQLGAYPSVFFAPGGKQRPTAEVADLLQDPRTRGAIPSMPSQRWVVTPRIEALHLDQVHRGTELEDEPSSELRTLLGPLLRERYGDGRDVTVMELGPATSTTVAESLPGARYLGVDLSGPYLEQSSRMLDGRLAAQHFHALGDTYALPVQEGACDLVITSCHPPFVSASPQDKCLALDEVARALAPGGEFILFPYDFEKQPSEVNEHLRKRFELVDSRMSPLGDGRAALVLRKRPDGNNPFTTR